MLDMFWEIANEAFAQLPFWGKLALAAWGGGHLAVRASILAGKGAARGLDAFLVWKARPSKTQRMDAMEARFDDLYQLIDQRTK